LLEKARDKIVENKRSRRLDNESCRSNEIPQTISLMAIV